MPDLEPTARLVMPSPISTNNLFANVPGRGRVKTKRYSAWQKAARDTLAAQMPLPRFTVPVEITIYVGEVGVGNMDSDNTAKALIDALKDAEVIRDDSRKWMRRSSAEWVPGMRGCVVVIEPHVHAPRAADVMQSVPAGLRELLR